MHSQVSNVVSRTNGVATDRNGSEIRIGDTVREISGESRTGVIKHLFRAFAFLHSRDVTENTGIWVARTNNLATIAAKGGRIQQSAGPDLTKMNPALQRGGPGAMAPPPIVARVAGRDRTIGQTVTVRSGPYKGSLGIVKDASDKTARVELHARNKIITIEKTKLGFKEYVLSLFPPLPYLHLLTFFFL
jgi:transcription elongation factor SPT5